MLSIFEEMPTGLLQCQARDLHNLLSGPSLIHLQGTRPEPLFISVLLHGNETSGWDAVRSILKAFEGRPLPRSISLFIGNVQAAREGVRHLQDQPDYNRIWKAEGHHLEDVMVRQVLEQMQERDVFACIDIHNNTGRNPHYGCVNRLSTSFFQLATMYSKTVVYFLQPDSVLTVAFANICPAVTIECGKPGEAAGILHVKEFILAALALDHLEENSMIVRDIDLFHTIAIVKLNDEISVGLENAQADLELLAGLDQMNFREIVADTQLAKVHNNAVFPVQARNEFGKDVADRYFKVKNGCLCTRVPVMPAMLTLDLDIIRQDCLCYLMERLDLSKTLST